MFHESYKEHGLPHFRMEPEDNSFYFSFIIL